MGTFRVIFLIVTMLTFLQKNQPVQNEFRVTTLQVNWDLDSLQCPEKKCSNYFKIDRNGTLYNLTSNHLFILSSTDSTIQDIDLADFARTAGIPSFQDFIPYEDNTVVLQDNGGFGFRLLLLELNSSELKAVLPSKRLVACETNVSNFYKYFSRISQEKKLVVCSVNDDRLLHINIVNLDNQVIEQDISTMLFDTNIRPWGQLKGGLDGNLYLLPTYPYIRLFSLAEPTHDTFIYVARFNPSSGAWSTVQLSNRYFPHLPSDAEIDHALISAVDKDSNIYITIMWLDTESQRHIDFLKLTSSGELVWHLMEPELDEYDYYIDLLKEDTFLTLTGAGLQGLHLTRIEKYLLR